MRTEETIKELMENAKEMADSEGVYYEGVYEALAWVLGEIADWELL